MLCERETYDIEIKPRLLKKLVVTYNGETAMTKECDAGFALIRYTREPGVDRAPVRANKCDELNSCSFSLLKL